MEGNLQKYLYPGLAALAGLVLLVSAVIYYISESETGIENPKETRGVVAEVIKISRPIALIPGRERSYFVPVVRFATPAGDTITFSGAEKDDPDFYKPGDSVPVIYNSRRPADAAIIERISIFDAGFLSLLVFGLIMLAVAALLVKLGGDKRL